MFWKSLIGALTISFATTLSIIPTASAIATNSIRNIRSTENEQTYNISFKEITAINGSNVKTLPDNRSFYLHYNSVVGASCLPSNFYKDDGFDNIYFANQTVWDQVGNIYGYDSSTSRFVISDLMSKILFLMYQWQL